MPSEKSPTTLVSFLALYLTTLFSLDAWAAARASPYRAPSTSHLNRPGNPAPTRDSYQGQMHGRGRHGFGDGSGSGSGSGGGGGGVGRLPQTRDSRAPLRMGGNAACGACMI